MSKSTKSKRQLMEDQFGNAKNRNAPRGKRSKVHRDKDEDYAPPIPCSSKTSRRSNDTPHQKVDGDEEEEEEEEKGEKKEMEEEEEEEEEWKKKR